MKQIIKQLSIKIFQVFFPIFLTIIAIAIAVTPLILTVVLESSWLLLMIITIPLGIAMIFIVNNTTNWYSVWDYDDIKEAIEVYRTKAPYEAEHSFTPRLKIYYTPKVPNKKKLHTFAFDDYIMYNIIN